MKKLLILFLIFSSGVSSAQTQSDSTSVENKVTAGDDPSQFLSRLEVFNEFQKHNHNATDYYLNQTTIRTIIKIGKRFTTRLDLPFMYNSISTKADYKKFGLSDISFRLLGYKFIENPVSAITASIEVSLNTAQSQLIGFGKNIILPVFSYTRLMKSRRMLLAVIFTEAISFSGDENRSDISFSKIQPIVLRIWTPKFWSLLAPELYVDYIKGGASMNLEGRATYAPVKRMNFWAQIGVGLFGDFGARYQWGTEVGYRFYFMRDPSLQKKLN